MADNVAELMQVKQVANALSVSPETIRRHIAAGDLQAVRLGERGRLRVRRSALEAFLRPAGADR